MASPLTLAPTPDKATSLEYPKDAIGYIIVSMENVINLPWFGIKNFELNKDKFYDMFLFCPSTDHYAHMSLSLMKTNPNSFAKMCDLLIHKHLTQLKQHHNAVLAEAAPRFKQIRRRLRKAKAESETKRPKGSRCAACNARKPGFRIQHGDRFHYMYLCDAACHKAWRKATRACS